jgi:hypothetical protein
MYGVAMYIERVPNRNSPPAVLLRESFRDGSRVRKRTLANLSDWPPERIDALRAVLKGKTLSSLPVEDSFEIIRSRPHGHAMAVLGVLRSLGLVDLIDRRRSRQRDLVLAMLVARILDPRSKLATARGLDGETLSSSLGEVLGVADADVDELYSAMDWLLERQTQIEAALAKRHLTDDIFALYDVSSTYFEGHCCPLAKRGHSRDGKKDKLQIVFGLLCDAEGRPVAVEVFAGNTGDPKTVPAQVKKIREHFHLEHLVLIGDRGMLTHARIRDDLAPVEGIAWITALRAPAIRRLVKTGVLQLSLFDECKLAEITSPDFPEERLVVCRNPLLAADRARTREELLSATERDLEKIVAATKRKQRPLRGKAAIGVRVGRVLNRHKMAKHFRITITSGRLIFARKTKNIQAEAALDGFYVVRTSIPEEVMAAGQVVAAYKSLSLVERAFRSYKTVDLKVRPIHHWHEDRVRAHVFLCMLAYYVEWHMRELLAPILFDDEHPEQGERRRRSIVDPAKSSLTAERKAANKRTDDDYYPVHSFQSLLSDLATITKNRIRLKTEGQTEFNQLTTLTPLQQRAFDLLKVSCRL